MAWQKSPPELVETFDEVFPENERAERKSMFGYPCGFVGGNMFTGLHEARMIVRLPEVEREELIALGGKVFDPMPGRTMREYVVVPAPVLANKSKLRGWVDKAFEYASALPERGKKAAKVARPAKAAKAAKVPKATKAAKVPKATKAAKVPKATKAAKVPKATKAAKVPKATKAAKVPKATKAAKVPKATKAAKVPKATKAAKVPKATKAAKVPKATKAAKVPKATKAAKVPNAPKATKRAPGK